MTFAFPAQIPALPSGVAIESVIIVIWIALIIGVGLMMRKRVSSSGEFMIGGYTIPAWMLGFWSAGATVSAWAFFGLPGAIYASGPWQHWALCMPMALGYPLIVLLAGVPMRRGGPKYRLFTLPDYLASVYGGKAIRIFGAIGILIASVFYTTAQFKAIGVLLSSLLGIDYVTGAVLGIAVSVVYIAIGGFIAGAIINTLNVSMMLVASFVAIGLGYLWTGGYTNMIQTIAATPTGPSYYNADLAFGGYYWLFFGCWVILGSFGMLGQPHITQKLMGIKKPSTLWLWALLASVIMGITCPAYCYLGLVTKYLTVVGSAPNIVAVFGSPDYVIAWLTVYKLGAEAPIVGGLLIAGVIAAAWSTIDGFLMMGGAAIARDIYNKCLRPDLTDKQLLKALRLSMVAVGVVMSIMTIFPPDIITWLAAIGWAQFAATLAPAFILSAIWKGITKSGGAAGVFVGLVVTAVLTLGFRLPMGTVNFFKVFYLDAGAWGFLLSFVTIIVISLVTKKVRGPLYYDIHKLPQPAGQ